MVNELPYQRILQECLKGELRVLNAHLPGKQKPLSVLLTEEYPGVVCSDGSAHLFKRKELEYLAGIINEDVAKALADARIDAVLIDIIGSKETIKKV